MHPKNILIAATALTGVATMASPVAAAPYVSTNRAAFESIRDTVDHSFSFAKTSSTQSIKLGTSYTKDGVTFKSASSSYLGGWNDGSFGTNKSYISALTGDSNPYGAVGTLSVSFNGPVLGLWLGSNYCEQTVTYIFNGITKTIDVAGNGASTFIGFDAGGPGTISVLFKATTELNVLKFQTAVPEPATWMMMMLGFGAVAGTLRRRKVTTRVAFA